jgi:serine/threonine protein kinase
MVLTEYLLCLAEFALAVFALTMLAVSDMHQRDVLHNNLERGTIVYHEKLHPTCADFGYAKPLIHELNGQECVGLGETGAPAFAAPETNSIHGPDIEESGYVTTKSDVYAAAAVAFRGLFASSLELDQDQRVDWEEKVAEYAQFQPHPANKLVLDLFRQCLQRDPHMRPSALSAIRQASQYAKLITLAHYNPDDAREPHYIGSPDDWRIYDWAAERKCHSSSLQAWHSVW